MRIIVAGSRYITDYTLLKEVIAESNFEITEILCGMAEGVDKLGERFAKENNIPLRYFPAQWHQYGKSAGPIRNEKMAQNADGLIYIWDGESRGTKNMISLATQYGLKVYGRIVTDG